MTNIDSLDLTRKKQSTIVVRLLNENLKARFYRIFYRIYGSRSVRPTCYTDGAFLLLQHALI